MDTQHVVCHLLDHGCASKRHADSHQVNKPVGVYLHANENSQSLYTRRVLDLLLDESGWSYISFYDAVTAPNIIQISCSAASCALTIGFFLDHSP